MDFEILDRVSDAETIAVGTRIREIRRLQRVYGRGAGGNAKAQLG
ncbi:MAG: hypothetical protein ACR2G6_04425 [Gemmatimonadaceae bacterium]